MIVGDALGPSSLPSQWPWLWSSWTHWSWPLFQSLFKRQQTGTIFSQKSFWATSESDITAFQKSLVRHHHQHQSFCTDLQDGEFFGLQRGFKSELGHWDWSSMSIGSVIWTLKWIWRRRALMIHIYSLMYRDFSFFLTEWYFSWRSEYKKMANKNVVIKENDSPMMPCTVFSIICSSCVCVLIEGLWLHSFVVVLGWKAWILVKMVIWMWLRFHHMCRKICAIWRRN